MNTNPNDPAFGFADGAGTVTAGLTKREDFAKAAMKGFCAHPEDWSFDVIAAYSVKMADALIAELNKEVES